MAANADQEDRPVASSPLPAIAQQKGGGAIHGIGETFSTNRMTGSASLTVPIAVTAGRSGFTPQLSLTYDTGTGNGIFGFGWSLSLPEIARKTDKGLPRYDDAGESDVFILSGYEDLVPSLHGDAASGWHRSEEERNGFLIRRYRPRIEGLFARIERWTRIHDGETHWRVTSKDNVLTIYGDTPESRVCDPERKLRVFKWLISASYDPQGNAIVYEYAAEDLCGVDRSRPSEQRRGEPANRYIKRVLYGNRSPMTYAGAASAPDDWMFEVVFDYGDEAHEVFRSAEDQEFVRFAADRRDWPVRRDPFSTWRSGFEIRTYRLCRRALMMHHFPDELERPRTMVRSTDFAYDAKPIGSFLTNVVKSGYRWTPEQGAYLRKCLPPLTLRYAPSPLETETERWLEWRDAEADNLPEGIDGARYRWVDLDGEGISGVLAAQGAGWYFKRNLGDGRFGESKLVARKPASARPDAPPQLLLDVGGEGQIDLVDLTPGVAGFYERAHDPAEPLGLDAGWGRFRPFRSFPVVDWRDPNLRFVDLTGDGIADILITEDVAFRWHPSFGPAGFGPALRIPAPQDEDEGPRVLFSDPTQSVYLADMSGDGLSDIVRIRNGEVCYWPNRGYGRFGQKIVMDGSPWFDAPGLFDNDVIRLADTDGSGTTDIIYLGAGQARIYLNESGNALSAPHVLHGLPDTSGDSISTADFLGRGTACLVWSSPLPAHAGRPLRYVDLMEGRKPHLLVNVANNLGAETIIEYAESSRFYLADRAAGKPWLTPLPFPVHVVSRIETFDAVGRNRFVSTMSYHHGFYDGAEREFRGFGRVDQYDAEVFADAGDSAFPQGDNVGDNEAATWRQPPVLTRTWYHTGVFPGIDRISRHLAHEYYHAPDEPGATSLDDTILPHELAPEEAREACRALKGTRLREEIYALDGSAKADIPYSVTEGNATIRLLQPRACNRHSVFFAHPRESLALTIERTLYDVDGTPRTDPRISHSVTLEVDAQGNPLLSASIGYGRRHADRSPLLSDDDRGIQATPHAMVTRNRYTNAVERPDAYHTPLLAETRVYELVGLPRPRFDTGEAALLRFAEIRRLVAQADDGQRELPFQDFAAAGAIGPGPYQRLIGHKRTRYRSDDLRHLLPLGRLEALALPGEGMSLALTQGLIAEVYGDRLPHPWPLLHDECGYVDADGDGRAWTPSGRTFYSPDPDADAAAELAEAKRHFFLPRRFRDAFGNDRHVTYDPHDLVPVETRDPVGNVTHARIDYRVMQPDRVIDPNGNRSDTAFDALGRVVGTAVMGKATETIGDSLEGFVADLPPRVILAHLCRPLEDPWAILGNATTRLLYDAFAFDSTRHEAHPRPVVTCSLARETHVSDLAPGKRTRIQQAFCYSDGFGREAQHKLQAEPGTVPEHGDAIVDPRWVGSGWTIFNNKGKPVRKYEPFFSATHLFEFAATVGVSGTMIYDPVGRVVAMLNPDHTFQKTVFDPWRQEIWDSNDTVLLDPGQDPDVAALIRAVPAEDYLPTWYRQRADGALGTAEAGAAAKAAVHQATPQLTFLDALGRDFLSILHNRFMRGDVAIDEFYPTRSTIDIQGNERAVTDALDRVIMTYDYDVAGATIHQNSPDAGRRWVLNASDGQPVLAFDSRHHRLRYTYDRLRRQMALFVRTGDGPEQLAEQSEYGEDQPDAIANNLRGRLYRQLDGAGIAAAPSYDFKGNLLRATRQMLSDYRDQVDWAAAPRLEQEVFTSETGYDALNRAITMVAPDSTIIRPAYNDANLLERLDASLKGSGNVTRFVKHIEYNARGQRLSVAYGNGARATNDYDPLTFRLTHLKTRRDSDGALLQDLSYVYDPVGNITSISDDARETIYFRNQIVRANGDYLYDAVYRLIGATGREHAGAAGRPETSYDDAGRVRLLLPGDGQAMHRYQEQYRYDAVGNILELIHAAPGDAGWRRHYGYDEIAVNNRLGMTRAGAGADHYTYDANGNMTRMRHLPVMRWDYRNMLHATQTQSIHDGGEAPTTYYVYDAGGQRARKVTEDAAGRRRHDRIYLAGFEIDREYASDSVTLERTTLHVNDGTRRIALVDTSGDTTTIRYQYDNNIGSACLELDQAAAVITYEEYYPYGSTSFQAGRSIAEVSLKRYRFTGQERDDGTGLSYHGARYYAPWLGRWISCDPVGLAAGINVYLYASASPICLSDPNGTQSGPPHPEDTDTHQFWPREDKSEAPDESSSTTPPADSGGAKPGVAASVWNWVKNAASSIWSWIKGAAASVADATTQAATAVWDWTKQAAATVSDAATTAWNWTKQAAATAWDWTKQAASTAWNWTKQAAGTAWDWLKGAAGAVWDWTKRAAATVWNWALAPLIRTATNAAFGALIGFALGGVPGAIAGGVVGAVTGAVHGWGTASAHSYDWGSLTGWAEFVADNTWSLPNSAVASVWATLNIWNTTNDALSAGTGKLVFNKSWAANYATTFGNVTAGTQVPLHEGTHAFQARIFGPLFYPSLIANYAINIFLPFWLIYHDKRYPNAPITTFGQYFSRGVYPHVWAEDWAYSVEGGPQ